MFYSVVTIIIFVIHLHFDTLTVNNTKKNAVFHFDTFLRIFTITNHTYKNHLCIIVIAPNQTKYSCITKSMNYKTVLCK